MTEGSGPRSPKHKGTEEIYRRAVVEENSRFNVDEGLRRLEEINQMLAQSNITLEESIRLYNEGTQLAAKCKEHLEGVEKELKIVNP